MQEIEITISRVYTREAIRTETIAPSSVHGWLAVYRTPYGYPAGYPITIGHIESGAAVCRCKDQRAADRAAQALIAMGPPKGVTGRPGEVVELSAGEAKRYEGALRFLGDDVTTR